MNKIFELIENGAKLGSIQMVGDWLLCSPKIQADSDCENIATRLLEMALKAFPPGKDVHLLLLDTYGACIVNAVKDAAATFQFCKYGEKHVYTLPLDTIPFEEWRKETGVFSYQDLETLGDDFFANVFREIQSESFDPAATDAVRDPGKALKGLKDPERYIPHFWLTAFLGDDPVGIILGGNLGKGKEKEGTCQFIGIRPKYRGRGYGSILFRKALLMFKEHGMEKYVDSTDSGNKPMLRVFQKNNCSLDCIQYMYRCAV